MIRVKTSRDRFGCYNGFSCSGHAGFAAVGSDIVCAAVSALTQTTILALEQLVNLDLNVTAEEAFLKCVWENAPETIAKSNLLLQAMILGLLEIQSQYPEYLSLSEAEV